MIILIIDYDFTTNNNNVEPILSGIGYYSLIMSKLVQVVISQVSGQWSKNFFKTLGQFYRNGNSNQMLTSIFHFSQN